MPADRRISLDGADNIAGASARGAWAEGQRVCPRGEVPGRQVQRIVDCPVAVEGDAVCVGDDELVDATHRKLDIAGLR